MRPRRRTLGIEVTSDGGVLFAVPADADPAAVADAVRSRLPRLAREVRRRQERPAEPVKDLIGGTSFSYLGRRHRLRVVSSDSSDPSKEAQRVRLYRGWLESPRLETTGEEALRITEWYTACGDRWLSARLPSLASRIGVTPRPVVARDLGRRWGALERDGSVSVHWAMMQLPPRWSIWSWSMSCATCGPPDTAPRSVERCGSRCPARMSWSAGSRRRSPTCGVGRFVRVESARGGRFDASGREEALHHRYGGCAQADVVDGSLCAHGGETEGGTESAPAFACLIVAEARLTTPAGRRTCPWRRSPPAPARSPGAPPRASGRSACGAGRAAGPRPGCGSPRAPGRC